MSIFILFFTFLSVGTFFHLKHLGISSMQDYGFIPAVGLFIIAYIYSSGIVQNVRNYLYALTSSCNRFAVQCLTASLSWLVIFIMCFQLNHTIWYIGIGWLFYNMGIVAVFLLCFVLLLLPSLIKDVIVIDVEHDGSQLSSGSERSKVSVTESTGTDITVDNVMIV